MARLFAAQVEAALQHPLQDIAVAHLGPDQAAASPLQGHFQAHVAHDRGHQGFFLQRPLAQEMMGADRHDMVAVHHLAGVIDADQPVAVPIQGDADVGVMAADQTLDRGRIGGAALAVDVASVGGGRRWE